MEKKMKKCVFLAGGLLALSGCQQGEQNAMSPRLSERDKVFSFINEANASFPRSFSVVQLKEYVRDGNLKEASRYVNAAIRVSPHNSVLHLINGFIYEELERVGDNSGKELIEVAYKSAYNIDPSRWYSAFLLGRHYLLKGDHQKAQQMLSNALLLKPDDPDVLYSLSYASYYLRDLPVAGASIQKAVTLRPGDPMMVRAAAIISASVGQDKKAREYLKTYGRLIGKEKADVTFVAQRIDDWKKTHAQALLKATCPVKPALICPKPQGPRCGPSLCGTVKDKEKNKDKEDEGAIDPKTGKKEPPKNKTIVFDCYILRVSENASTSKGSNIIQSFADIVFTFAGSGGGAGPSQTSWQKFETKNINGMAGGSSGFIQRTFNFGVTSAQLTYSVNIMNATDQMIEVLGRPTVAAMIGQTTDFFSGDRIQGFSQGNSGGSSISVDAGTKLRIKPQDITDDGKIVAQLTVTGALLMTPVTGGASINQQTLKTTFSSIETTVKSCYDETTLLAGLYEREQQSSKTGFPLLQDIPFIQYFFANETTNAAVKTVLYLLTPRKPSTLKACAKDFTKCRVSPRGMSKLLMEKGLLAVTSYTSLHYIIRHLLEKPAFFDFRSGDVLPPMWGGPCVRLDKKLDQLAAFIYF